MARHATAGERMARILAMVPWIAAHDGVTVDDICARVSITPDELTTDLEVVYLVGVHPFTPDELIDVVIEDGRVWVRYADYFARPLRLTPAQGLALVAAGSSLLSAPGSDPAGPLARGLAKLAAALGVDAETSVDVDLGPAEVAIYQALRQAIDQHRTVDLDYYGYGRDERSDRRVEPHRLYAHEGHWYLAAYCRRAEDDRVFRVDRVHAATMTDESFTAPVDQPAMAVFEPGSDDPRVVVELDPPARWVLDQYPYEPVEDGDDGRCRVTLAVTARPWLERLLLVLGPDARLVDGDDPALARLAADRLLARYRAEGG
jgi:proteasome accessory factor C